MITKEIDKYLRMPIEEFFAEAKNLTRMVNAFRDRGETYTFQVVLNNIYSLRKIPKLGPACINEIVAILNGKDIPLGMDLSEWEFEKETDYTHFDATAAAKNPNINLADQILLKIENLVEAAFAPCREYCNGLMLDDDQRDQIKEITKDSLHYKITSAVDNVKF